jgi:hypothetical protein
MNKNRMLSTDCETNGTKANGKRSKNEQRLTSFEKENYTRTID